MTTCPTCGAQNDPGNRFCDQCGTRLTAESPAVGPQTARAALPVAPAIAPDQPTMAAPDQPTMAAPDQPTMAAPVCPNCGATVLPGEAFCDNCGADLQALLQQSVPAAASAAGSAAEAATMLAAPAAVAEGTCPSCGATVLPGERFCDNCGPDLQTIVASAAPAQPPSAAPATPGPNDATIVAAPVPIEVAPEAPVSPDDATILATAEAAPAPPAAAVPAPPAAEAAPPAAEAAPTSAAVEAVPATEAPAPPAAEATPVAVEPAAPPPPTAEPPAEAAAEAAPSATPVPPTAEAAPTAPPAADAQAAYAARRAELEAAIARQGQIITQFEQMQATFGAATPAAVTAGLDEARAALARAEADLAALQPPAPAVDPAAVKGFEDEIARQGQIIAQFEQMQATFGAATPAAVTAGLNEARAALARAQAGLSALGAAPGSAPAAPAPVAPAPAASAPVTPAPAIEVPAAAPAAAPPAGPRLVVVDGGTVLPLATDKTEFVVGREDPVSNIHPEIDLTSFGGEMGGVSRQHARITSAGGQWMITDLNSTNYTRLDGARLEPNTATPLSDGARVQFGRVVLTFHL